MNNYLKNLFLWVSIFGYSSFIVGLNSNISQYRSMDSLTASRMLGGISRTLEENFNETFKAALHYQTLVLSKPEHQGVVDPLYAELNKPAHFFTQLIDITVENMFNDSVQVGPYYDDVQNVYKGIPLYRQMREYLSLLQQRAANLDAALRTFHAEGESWSHSLGHIIEQQLANPQEPDLKRSKVDFPFFIDPTILLSSVPGND